MRLPSRLHARAEAARTRAVPAAHAARERGSFRVGLRNLPSPTARRAFLRPTTTRARHRFLHYSDCLVVADEGSCFRLRCFPVAGSNCFVNSSRNLSSTSTSLMCRC